MGHLNSTMSSLNFHVGKKWLRFMEQPSHFLLGCSDRMSNADVNLPHHMKSLLRNGAVVLWNASDIILSYHALVNQAEI